MCGSVCSFLRGGLKLVDLFLERGSSFGRFAQESRLCMGEFVAFALFDTCEVVNVSLLFCLELLLMCGHGKNNVVALKCRFLVDGVVVTRDELSHLLTVGKHTPSCRFLCAPGVVRISLSMPGGVIHHTVFAERHTSTWRADSSVSR
jgi:hypothetical protein